jgi:hypothetical protein
MRNSRLPRVSVTFHPSLRQPASDSYPFVLAPAVAECRTVPRKRVRMTTFRQLNEAWNAEPNAPEPSVRVEGGDVLVSFRMNSQQFPQFSGEDFGLLRFVACRRYRLGATNDEGWFRGQRRFSKLAPKWGEFYEVTGDLCLQQCPADWIDVGATQDTPRHFLFYFRDETFECDASDWRFVVNKARPLSPR